MKKLTIALLMALACNNTLVQAGGEKTESDDIVFVEEQPAQEIKPRAKSSTRADLAKGLTALAGAGLLGYISYACYSRSFPKQKAEQTPLDKARRLAFRNIISKITPYIPTAAGKEYFAEYSGVATNGLAATSLGLYAAYKLGSVAKSKLSPNWKESLPLVGRYFKSAPKAITETTITPKSTKRISANSDFDAILKANNIA